MKKLLLVFMFVSLVGLPAGIAQAVAVGLSPSIMELVMHEGQVADVHYSVSRSESSGEFGLEVSSSDSTGITTFPYGTEVTIGEGTNHEVYNFALDTTGVEEGEYELFINFQELMPAEPAEGEILAIRYGLQGAVDLSVVSQEEYDQILAQNPVKLNRLFIDGDVLVTEKPITVNYELTNPGPVYIDKLTHAVQIVSLDGEVVEEVEFTDEVNLAPFQNAVFEKTITVKEEGEYNLRIQAKYNGAVLAENQVEATVIKREVVQQRGVEFAVGILAIVLAVVIGFAFMARKK